MFKHPTFDNFHKPLGLLLITPGCCINIIKDIKPLMFKNTWTTKDFTMLEFEHSDF